MKQTRFFLAITFFLSFSSCEKDNFDPPIETLEIPDFYEVGDVFSTTAVKVNNNNMVIGYTQDGLPGVRNYEFQSCAFIYDADLGITEQVAVKGAIGTWLFGINEKNEAVGGYVDGSVTSLGVIYDAEQPSFAFLKDATGITLLNSGDYYGGVALEITENARIFGEVYTLNPNGFTFSHACEFFKDGSPPVLLGEGEYSSSSLESVNENYAIVKTINYDVEPYFATMQIIDLGTGDIEHMSISSDTLEFTRINDISADNLAVGTYIDLAAFTGFTYDIVSGEARYYSTVNSLGSSDYVWYEFTGINSIDQMAGIGFRQNKETGLPQARAMEINTNFQGFDDITPENGGAYAEAYDINDNGIIVGYMGIASRTTVRNRAFLIRKDR